MATSLEKLVNNLSKGDTSKFKETRIVFNNTDLEVVIRKGVYAYEYLDRWSKLDENRIRGRLTQAKRAYDMPEQIISRSLTMIPQSPSRGSYIWKQQNCVYYYSFLSFKWHSWLH
ncbi:Uncharacterized protein FWK35_00016985 [Aphis craccivora]|uniref:Uncharacterized protein n=1 Tax=Aphis craccivora TaxID=307492 RepID=A0A6G0XWG5_APHCR|nr:Uncharacterized protein FWK35_00016985 [Aphis craccivora]